MESSLHSPIHPGGGGTSDLAMRNHAGLHVEEAAFFLQRGGHLYIREEQDRSLRISQELRIAPLTGNSPAVPQLVAPATGTGGAESRPGAIEG